MGEWWWDERLVCVTGWYKVYRGAGVCSPINGLLQAPVGPAGQHLGQLHTLIYSYCWTLLYIEPKASLQNYQSQYMINFTWS